MFDFLKSGSAKIQVEIDAESQRAQEAVTTEARLKEARSDALLAGDTKELDRIDAQLVASSRDAGRRAERVLLLEGKLAEAQQLEDGERLDAVTARTDKARRIGEDVLRKEYVKHATALAATLAKLKALDWFIADQSRLLENAGRPAAASPNACRSINGVSELRTVMVKVDLTDPRHPNHAEYYATHRGPFHFSESTPRNPVLTLANGQQIPFQVEISVEREHREPGAWVKPVYEEIANLPGLMADALPLYSFRPVLTDTDERAELAKLAEELGV